MTQGGAKPHRTGSLVLLVMDGCALLKDLRDALMRSGIQTLVAESKEDALRATCENMPNLILLDISLAGGGFDLCRTLQLESGCWRAPVIFVAPQEEIPAKVTALDCGAVDFLNKPLVIPEVVARVRMHLKLQHAMESLAEMHAEHLEVLAGAQQGCIPQPDDVPGARFQVAMRQVHAAGGDFYDDIDLGERQCDYLVADASGHDLSSSYWTLALKTLFLEYSSLMFSPVDAMYLLNRALIKILPDAVFLPPLKCA